jgi:excisionase family DNA binding protein
MVITASESRMTNDTEKSEPPILLTGQQAAALLSVSERTLFTLAKAGNFPQCKIGPRGVRYRRADLVRYADSLAIAS